MAGVVAAVPVVLTMMQKLEKAWDDIARIFTLTPAPTTFDEFMSQYSGASGLGTFIDTLIKGSSKTPRSGRMISAVSIKSTLFNILYMMNTKQRHDLVRFVLHLEGNGTQSVNPRTLMGLFVCGLIDLDTVPFSDWINMKGDAELGYIREFLSLLDSGDEIEVYSNVNKAVEELDANVIPDSLFLTSSIPDGAQDVIILDSFPAEDPWRNLQNSLDMKDTITSKPIFWYAYVIRNYNPTRQQGLNVGSTSVQAWADTSPGITASPAVSITSSPDTTTVKCIGIVDGGKKYVFGYNFPKYITDEVIDETHAWNMYIIEPYRQYASVFQSLTKIANTSIISKVTLEHRMLIYIHVLVMGMYGEQRNFYALNANDLPDENIQDALVAGKTCSDYLALLSHTAGSATALGIASGALDGAVMARLARAHLALMRKNPYFTFQGGITTDFNDELDST